MDNKQYQMTKSDKWQMMNIILNTLRPCAGLKKVSRLNNPYGVSSVRVVDNKFVIGKNEGADFDE